ncbi:MAG: hypothetical protein NT118_09000 [Lentisphaerae bacterium]|nr:hypothetical protein [Lentisphaerota bacterium]
MMGLSDSIVSLLFTLGAVFAFGTLAVCVFMLVAYLIMKDGTKSACRAIEKFFGSGCRVSTRDHTVTVRQVVAVLELATASGEFEHNYNWHRDKRRFLGLPVPFTGKAAACRHDSQAENTFTGNPQCECRRPGQVVRLLERLERER